MGKRLLYEKCINMTNTNEYLKQNEVSFFKARNEF